VSGKLKIYKGGPHGICTTLKDEVNADLLALGRGMIFLLNIPERYRRCAVAARVALGGALPGN